MKLMHCNLSLLVWGSQWGRAEQWQCKDHAIGPWWQTQGNLEPTTSVWTKHCWNPQWKHEPHHAGWKEFEPSLNCDWLKQATVFCCQFWGADSSPWQKRITNHSDPACGNDDGWVNKNFCFRWMENDDVEWKVKFWSANWFPGNSEGKLLEWACHFNRHTIPLISIKWSHFTHILQMKSTGSSLTFGHPTAPLLQFANSKNCSEFFSSLVWCMQPSCWQHWEESSTLCPQNCNSRPTYIPSSQSLLVVEHFHSVAVWWKCEQGRVRVSCGQPQTLQDFPIPRSLLTFARTGRSFDEQIFCHYSVLQEMDAVKQKIVLLVIGSNVLSVSRCQILFFELSTM